MTIPRFWQPPLLKAAPSVRLEHNDILILPSGFGVFYLGLAGVLFVFGSNYQNNLVLMLALLMFSLFSSCLLLCFRNLSGLTLRFAPGRADFAGQQVGFPVELSSDRHRHALSLTLEQGTGQRLSLLSSPGRRLELNRLGTRRGRLQPGRVRISSRYPLGLCRVWAHIHPEVACWVWPAPEAEQSAGQPAPALPAGAAQWQELEGLSPWQPGHSLSRVDWKQLARQRGKMLKQFSEQSQEACWLELDPGHPQLERHLSLLAAAALHCQQAGIPFGLRGSKPAIPPSLAAEQLSRVLDRLAGVPHAH
ncbi:DUF58 domain-containing protein [Ferrimonas sediminicola]|uniref:DUF58 domain-containing protein n=1 Tax=Ferrimonas sediminicola TaxID=2569538 RepID=A0A4U1BDE2_9GAMM|nr:DUF58 domain-containing protein [Ferrimonas sediminicola]TKB48986.1 DUF58 domain-containing protein [Ferrimonas sediminicola]